MTIFTQEKNFGSFLSFRKILHINERRYVLSGDLDERERPLWRSVVLYNAVYCFLDNIKFGDFRITVESEYNLSMFVVQFLCDHPNMHEYAELCQNTSNMRF